MEEYELDPAIFNQGAQAEQDAKLAVLFYKKPVKDEGKSITEGRPIFVELDYIKIIAPGNSTNIIDRPVDDSDKARFKSKYEAWLKGETAAPVGTPLDEWPLINRSLVEELKFYNIRTVENLVDAPDNLAASITGFFSLKGQAQKFLEASKTLGGDVLTKVEEFKTQNEELQSQVESLKKSVAELTAKLQAPTIKKAV